MVLRQLEELEALLSDVVRQQRSEYPKRVVASESQDPLTISLFFSEADMKPPHILHLVRHSCRCPCY